MNIRERVLRLVGNADAHTAADSLLRKVRILCWETGLGPARNALPSVFGQQAVLYFPGRGGKFPLPCCESEGRVFLAAGTEDVRKISGMLLQSPGVEIWMKDGWFAGTARLLTPSEQADAESDLTLRHFFGEAGELIGKAGQKEYRLIEVMRSAPCTGTGGPGSKAWVWPLAFLLLLLPRKKK